MKSVYCAVRTDSLYKADYVSSLKGELLKPTAYMMHQQVKQSRIVRSAHTVFICFVFVREQMATFCPIQHKLIGFYNRDEKCLMRGTNRVFK